jgi:hypothetical protein
MIDHSIGEVGAFPDAHFGMAQQQEDVGGQIITADQFLLE